VSYTKNKLEKDINHKEESFRDHISTVDEKGKRIWIYPHKPHGRYYKLRTYASLIFLALFLGLPFVKIDGEPMFLFNVIERKFVLFGQIFWPQDFFIFGLGMVLFIVFVILFTVVFGRVFCGWACPQTIFMEMVFRKIEYWIEGDGPSQKHLNHEPWSSKKIFKKSLKHFVFLAISFIVSNTFLSYIIGIDELQKIVTESPSQHIGGFIAIIIFSLLFYGVFAFMREQVCTTVCPYGRLQGVMLDKDSLVVAYNHKIGEPRAKFHKNEDRTAGNCIDCNQCVKVCPTGIDIRHGTQLECTNCTACIDACDTILEKVNLPTGLIGFTSENRILGRTTKIFNTKMKAYIVVLALLIGIESYLIITRTTIDAAVNRTRGMLYQELKDDKISNLYSIKIVNKKNKPVKIGLEPDGFEGKIEWVGKPISLKTSGNRDGMFFVILDSKKIKKRKTKLYINIVDKNKVVDRVRINFFSPIVN
jgi:cytochrome c oxidase accessory protein FixG